MTNTDQDKKAVIAQVFARAASGYQRITHFPPLGQQLVELAEIPVGEGSGCGCRAWRDPLPGG